MHIQLSILLIAVLVTQAPCFQLASEIEYLSQGYKKVVTKFGEKYWQKNHTGGMEETIYENQEM
jgi:uncharacterized GH25 family protein